MILEDPQHEAFAQARFAGKPLVEAHYAAGYAGDKASASKLNQQFKIKERIAELYREAATQTAYEKADAVRDLLTIIHSCTSEAARDHPLCEARMGKDGLHYRFPPKLQAMARLIKLMSWDELVKSEVEVIDTLKEWLANERRHDPFAPFEPESNVARHSDVESQNDAAPPSDVEIDASNHCSTTLNHCSTIAQPALATGQPPLSARQELFANARVKGLGVMAAYHTAGYTGDSPNLAWRLNSMPAVKARIAELNGTVETATGYGKDDAIRDLVAIIHSHPEQAGPDHPLCEERLTSWGSYHRFPSKLGAITLLMKMLGWKALEQTKPPRDTLKEWLESPRT